MTQFNLKSGPQSADTAGVRLSRLVLETNKNRISLQFHPRMTVMAGIPAPARDHLIQEILGGFTGDRSGIHLELRSGADRRITVVRPRNGEHRVDAPDDRVALSEDYRTADGKLDVLARYGITDPELLTVGSSLSELTHEEAVQVARLGNLNQAELWSSANRVQVTETEFEAAASQRDKAERAEQAAAQVEQRHRDLDEAVSTQQHTQKNLVRVGGVALLGAAATGTFTSLTPLPLLAIALLAIGISMILRVKVSRARNQEVAALASAGTSSYLGFMVNQVNGMMQETDQLKRLTSVASDHREAAIAWTRLAGAVTVDWAFAHQREIDAVARLRAQISAQHPESGLLPDIDPASAAVAAAVLGRLSTLRRIGYGAESFPLFLDDPFVDLDSDVRQALLELIARDGGGSQVVLLSGSAEVAAWARRHAAQGTAALLEPMGPTAPTEPAESSTPRGQSGPGPAGPDAPPLPDTTSGESFGLEARGLAV